MKNEIQVDGWSFQVTQLRARRTPKFGEKFDSIYTITVVDDELYIEGLLTDDVGWTLKDSRAFRKFMKLFGISKFNYCRKGK